MIPERGRKPEARGDRAEENAAKLDAIRLYTLTELDPILGVTHRPLQTYIKDGQLKDVKIGATGAFLLQV